MSVVSERFVGERDVCPQCEAVYIHENGHVCTKGGSVGEQVVIPRAVLQKVLDTAVHSMDFGSGFLDHEEVEALRAVAVALGVDPMDATPSNFTCQFGGPHKPNVYVWGGAPVGTMCTECKAPLVTKAEP